MADRIERAVHEARAEGDELLVHPGDVSLVDRRDLAVEDELAELRIAGHVLEVARHLAELLADLDEHRRGELEGAHRRHVLECGDGALEHVDRRDVGDRRDELHDLARAHAVLALQRVGVGVELVWGAPRRGDGERQHPLLLVEDRAARHHVGELGLRDHEDLWPQPLRAGRLGHRRGLRDVAQHRVDLADHLAVLGFFG